MAKKVGRRKGCEIQGLLHCFGLSAASAFGEFSGSGWFTENDASSVSLTGENGARLRTKSADERIVEETHVYHFWTGNQSSSRFAECADAQVLAVWVILSIP